MKTSLNKIQTTLNHEKLNFFTISTYLVKHCTLDKFLEYRANNLPKKLKCRIKVVSRIVSRFNIIKRVAVWEGGRTYQLCLKKRIGKKGKKKKERKKEREKKKIEKGKGRKKKKERKKVKDKC